MVLCIMFSIGRGAGRELGREPTVSRRNIVLCNYAQAKRLTVCGICCSTRYPYGNDPNQIVLQYSRMHKPKPTKVVVVVVVSHIQRIGCVDVGQSSKTFGYGCTSCWG